MNSIDRNTYMRQLATEMHHRLVRKFPRRHVHVSGKDSTWGADLADMGTQDQDRNDGYRYILVVIDIYTKYIWAEPLETKTGKEVAAAFAKIFAKGRVPKLLWVDAGSEFRNPSMNKLLKQHDIEIYTTNSEIKVANAERAVQTLKTIMNILFTQHKFRKWVTALPYVVTEYNDHKHGVINMTPKEASEGGLPDVVAKELPDAEALRQQAAQLPNTTFQLGDIVRIPKYKGHFEKGFTSRWTQETFEVDGVKQTPNEPDVYYLRDLLGEEIKGSFYAQELLRVRYPWPIRFVEKVLERKTVKGKRMALVKFESYDSRFNRWIFEEDIK